MVAAGCCTLLKFLKDVCDDHYSSLDYNLIWFKCQIHSVVSLETHLPTVLQSQSRSHFSRTDWSDHRNVSWWGWGYSQHHLLSIFQLIQRYSLHRARLTEQPAGNTSVLVQQLFLNKSLELTADCLSAEADSHVWSHRNQPQRFPDT